MEIKPLSGNHFSKIQGSVILPVSSTGHSGSIKQI